jgi:hypothetical protein
MRDATTVLEIIRERGKRGLPLERVYRCLFNSDLYRLYATKRGSRSLIGVARIVSQSTPQCSRRRSR